MTTTNVSEQAEPAPGYRMNATAKLLCGSAVAVIAMSEAIAFSTDMITMPQLIGVCAVASVGLATGAVIDERARTHLHNSSDTNLNNTVNDRQQG